MNKFKLYGGPLDGLSITSEELIEGKPVILIPDLPEFRTVDPGNSLVFKNPGTNVFLVYRRKNESSDSYFYKGKQVNK